MADTAVLRPRPRATASKRAVPETARFLVRRVLQMVVTLWIIASLIFVLLRMAPGDPASVIIDPTFPTSVKEQLMHEYGLDRSTPAQYVLFIKNLATGNFGVSFFSREPVINDIGTKALNTAMLAFSAFLFAYPLGVAAGVYLAVRRGTWRESAGMSIALFFRSAPAFWIGMLALMLFSFRLGWFPAAGMRDAGYESSGTLDTFFSVDFLHHLILPTVVAGLEFAVLPLLLTRTSMLDVLDEDYVELAKAKGLSPRRVLFRHALRNALLPVVTEAAVFIGLAFGALTVIEVVFSWPGLGREIALAVTRHDYPVAQAAFILLAALISVMNLLADLLYRRLDPRISYGARDSR